MEYENQFEMALVELLRALKNYRNVLETTGKELSETVVLLTAQINSELKQSDNKGPELTPLIKSNDHEE